MKLEGIHHITAITGDAPGNVDFYAGTLGLRLVKKSVNQDDPTVYHLFYSDEKGSAGADITFFEYHNARRGRAGAGMVHRIVWRIGSEEALEFWTARLSSAGVDTERGQGRLRFDDPEGLALELRVVESNDDALTANHPDIPNELALLGFDGVHAYSADPAASEDFLRDTMGFESKSRLEWSAHGDSRTSFYVYDEAPASPGVNGAGTVHHVAWASSIEEHDDWRTRVASANPRVTPVIDRYYFKSIYFTEPSGVLFEIATLGPGFAVDEPLESLGESLALPPNYEPLRAELENKLTPIKNPRTATPLSSG